MSLFTMSENESKSWLGTPLTEMYRGQGPWCFAASPISPSKYHHVLFQMPVTLEKPPEPHYNSQPKHWDDDHIRMPYSEQSLFLVKENGEEVVKPRWDIICAALSTPINSVDDLETAINTYNSTLPKFTALSRFFNDTLSEDESEYFFKNILPGIIQLALRLPEFVPGSLPLLKRNVCKSLSLSQLQIASLLANAFLCTFIWRKETAGVYPSINFLRLYTSDIHHKRENCVSEKLKCIVHYFKTVITKYPVGVITFERKCTSRNQIPRWDLLENNIGNTRLHIDSCNSIEDGLGFLQVDFANKFVGGGVLGYGCVQEEIRFVTCPELIVCRLFTEELGGNEAVTITGIQNFSKYSGYSQSFQWDGPALDATPFDEYGRRRTSVLVIDATHFHKAKDQYHCSAILRELNKAYTGFNCREKNNVAPIATGNWGCGAFNGDPNLKCLIQLMACSAANRDLVYYSFGNTELRDQFYNMYMFLANNGITISQLWRYLCRFCAANLAQDKLYSFIQQCHFDLKSQPTLKNFFRLNVKKTKLDNNTPSTSSNHNDNKIKNPQPSTKHNEKKDTQNGSSLKPHKGHFQATSPKKSKPEEQHNDPVDSESIIQLIDMIDGSKPKEKRPKNEEPNTLFSEIDKMKNVNIKDERSNDERNIKDSVEILMEIDTEEESKPAAGFIGDKKKKITDYFSKMTTHVKH